MTLLPNILAALLFSGCTGETEDTDETGDTGPSSIELAYDDSTAEGMSSPWGSDGTGAIGVHFTADGPTQLLGARYYIGNQGIPTTPFDVEVSAWDAGAELPGEVIHPISATPTGPDTWLDVDLSAAELQVEADFVVAMVFTTPPGMDGSESLFLGADETDPDQRTYIRSGVWGTILQMFGHRADLMIHAVVEG